MMNLRKNQENKMWIVIKFKPNQFQTLKQEFKKKLEIEPTFFFPKLSTKIFAKPPDALILAFVYHPK